MPVIRTFRRALIDRPRQQVLVETEPGVFHFLPGAYRPEVVLAKIIAARYVDLAKWQPSAAP